MICWAFLYFHLYYTKILGGFQILRMMEMLENLGSAYVCEKQVRHCVTTIFKWNMY